LALHHGICRRHKEDDVPDTFIQRYVFPDGELHRVDKVIATAERAGQELRDAESLREHYALTLRHWVANLEANRDAAIADVGPERERVWRLYMTASALAFERGDVSIFQMLMAMPGEEPHPLSLARPSFVKGEFAPLPAD
jgi:cyclopropane-fatty-acyl-phospholipid synthase